MTLLAPDAARTAQYAGKVIFGLVVVVGILSLAWYAHALRVDRNALAAQNQALMVRAQAENDNADRSRQLVEKETARARDLALKVDGLLQEVRRERQKPTPKCEALALAPLHDAVNGVRGLRAARGGSPAAAPPVVLP